MGKSQKPLRIILTDRDLYERADVQALVEQGHDIVLHDEPAQLYMGRGCWYMDHPHMDKHLDTALKEARKRVYAKESA